MQDQYQEGQILDGSDGRVYIVRGGVPQPMDGGQGGVQLSGPDPKLALDRTKTTLEIQKAIRDAVNADRGSLPPGYRFNAKGVAEPIPGLPPKQAETGKPLRQGDGDKLEAEVGTYSALRGALSNFADDFGGNFIGGLENAAQAVSPIPVGTPGQADWWANFRQTDNVIRNSLYGASLTAGEKQAYNQTTISPSMQPGLIRKNLARRAEIIRTALARKVARFKAAGYNPAEIDAATGEFGTELTPDYKPPKEDQRTDRLGVPLLNVGGDQQIQFNGDGSSGDPKTGLRLTTDQESQINKAIRTGDQGQALALMQRFTGNPPTAETVDSIRNGIAAVKANPNARLSFDYSGVDNAAQSKADREKYGGYLPQAIKERQEGGKTGQTASFIRQATNGVTIGAAPKIAGGIHALFTGLPLKDRIQQMEALNEADNRVNPRSSLAGNVIGGAASAGGVEYGAGRLAARLPGVLGRVAASPRTADAIYGLGAGAVASGGDPVQTLESGAAGVGGGMFGRAATRGVANTVGGVRNAAIDELRTRGLPMTVGQVLSQSGRGGAAIKRIEDAMTSLPIVGNMINARRLEGLRGMNRSAFNEALEPIGQTVAGNVGEEGVQEAGGLVSGAYDAATNGVRLHGPSDPAFAGDMRTAFQNAGRLPATMADNANYTLNTRVGESFDPNGEMTGSALQQALRGLRRDAASMRPQPFGQDFGNVTRDAEAALEGLATRQAPEIMPGLRAANEAYGRTGIVRDAVGAARSGSVSGEGGIFTAAQLANAASKNARRFGGTHATPQQPFYGLTTAARDVLPSRIPDSGTAARLMVGTALAGGSVGGGEYAAGGDGSISASAAATLALLTVLGTRPGQQALVAGLTRRPDALRHTADVIARNQRFGGILGAGATVPLLSGN